MSKYRKQKTTVKSTCDVEYQNHTTVKFQNTKVFQSKWDRSPCSEQKTGVRRLYAQKHIVNNYKVTLTRKFKLKEQSEIKRPLRVGVKYTLD